MIVYLHGFNSSPQSSKAQYFMKYLEERGMADRFACPQLSHWPNEAIAAVEAEMARRTLEGVTLVGSSLGGFYATWLAETYGVPAVLINPAIDPHVGLRAFLGPQQNYHSGEKYELTEEHLRQWAQLSVPKVHPERYLLLVETGDEVINYRAAVKKYRGAMQLVMQGDDHTLVSFPEQIPLILQFAEMT